MADTAEILLPDVKSYLNITWQDDATDKKITGYIKRGMARLQQIAGAPTPIDFITESLSRALLLDYCRYANSQALEVFEKNFESELLDLNLTTQAPFIDNLVVRLTPSAAGVFATVSPAPDDGNGYVYKTGIDLINPERLAACIPGQGYTVWQGDAIAATAGQEILMVEVNEEYQAERAGKATV
jgi:hypothetical protein